MLRGRTSLSSLVGRELRGAVPRPRLLADVAAQPRSPITCSRRLLSSKARQPNTMAAVPPLPGTPHAPRAARTSASLAGARPAPPPPPCTPSPQAILPARIVESEVVQNILPFIGNAAYLALASGFVMTDLLTLRVMLVGGYSGLVVYHTLHPRPLRIPLRWSALFVAVNAAMAFKLATELWPPGLTEEELNLHRAFFNQLTPAQFKTLLDLGERRVLSTGTRLTTERVACSHLYFVEEGNADLTVNNEVVAVLVRGGFVNDVAFQQAGDSLVGAYGTAVAHGEMRVIAWDVRELRAALAKDTKLNDSMKHVLVGNLVEQLLQRYKATQHAQQKQELIDQQDRLRGLQGRRKSLRWTVTQSMREMNEPGAEPRTEQPEVKQQGAGGATSNRPDAQFHDSFEQLRRRTEANAIVTEVAERNKG